MKRLKCRLQQVVLTEVAAYLLDVKCSWLSSQRQASSNAAGAAADRTSACVSGHFTPGCKGCSCCAGSE
ncbi:hypothetical protein V5799_021563 [Amblyomma americanum]|uniref:Uncharacterized protein n=1 Tax=Amblyomma americanum TaxID=6943 RepID=A0AAQ4FN19_AMBAM